MMMYKRMLEPVYAQSTCEMSRPPKEKCDTFQYTVKLEGASVRLQTLKPKTKKGNQAGGGSLSASS